MVVNDITKNPRFKDKPFVASRPSVHFFAAVTLRTKTGFEIGTLSVWDEEPRNGLTDDEAVFMEDMARTIMNHLEMTRTNEAHRRGEKMVKGLGLFVDGRSHLDEWYDTADAIPKGSEPARSEKDLVGPEFSPTVDHAFSENRSQKTQDLEPQSSSAPRGRVVAEAYVHRPLALRPFPHTSIPSHTISSKTSSVAIPAMNIALPVAETKATTKQDARLRSNSVERKRVSPGLQESMLSAELKSMFSRASNIVRECIEVDGTLFLDASITSFGGQTGESNRRPDEETSKQKTDASDESRDDAPQESVPVQRTTKRHSGEKMCGILGYSTRNLSSLREDRTPESFMAVPEAFIQELLHKYPRGQVWDICEDGYLVPSVPSSPDATVDASAAHATTRRRLLRLASTDNSKAAEASFIVQMLPGARSVAFSPMWDSHRERYFSGAFAWTSQPTRILRPSEDLNFLSAFGNSIMADVARLDAIAADQAKSDFISSISHERTYKTPVILHQTASDSRASL
jgi:hypothetical protein